LRIELSGLDFHALVTQDGRPATLVSSVPECKSGEKLDGIPSKVLAFGKFNLYTINTVYTVDEEDQDEDEGYLHPIL
jgi:hypothetical protein